MSWLQAAKERCEKATAGPWNGDRFDGTVKYQVLGAENRVVLTVNHKSGEYGFETDGDEKFVLAARTDLPRALDLLERALPYLRQCLAVAQIDRGRDSPAMEFVFKTIIDEAQKLIEEIEG